MIILIQRLKISFSDEPIQFDFPTKLNSCFLDCLAQPSVAAGLVEVSILMCCFTSRINSSGESGLIMTKGNTTAFFLLIKTRYGNQSRLLALRDLIPQTVRSNASLEETFSIKSISKYGIRM